MKKKSPLIFISHINEEKNIAIALKSILKEIFQKNIRVFVSSDLESIPFGSEWFKEIKNAINECVFALILCSPKSIKEPWVNFETGAAYIKNKDVIPLCYGGLKRENLPIPLNYLQAVQINEIEQMYALFDQIRIKIDIPLHIRGLEDSDFNQRITSFKYSEQQLGISLMATAEKGGWYTQGEDVIIKGSTTAKFPFASLKIFQLSPEIEMIKETKINLPQTGLFTGRISTNSLSPGQYGILIELPNGTFTKFSFKLTEKI